MAALLLAIRLFEAFASIGPVHQGLKWLLGGDFFGPLFFPKAAPDWRDRFQAIALLLGLPAAFLLWHWRDSNVREQIGSQRKDINLKEFQEVQLRASGALAETLPAEAREQLQIAALHQLRGFLRGEYGESFRRPAFELLLAGHAAALERIGHLKAIEAYLAKDPPAADRGKEIATALEAAKARLTAVDRERLGILRDEAASIVGGCASDSGGTRYPLNGRRFDWIELPGQIFPEPRALARCSFIGADLAQAHLQRADLWKAHLERADLWGAHLEGAQLSRAYLERARLRLADLKGANLALAQLEGANLAQAHLEGANLREAHLEGANLREAHLEGANLREAHLEGAYLLGATFDANTILAANWHALAEAQRDIHRHAFIARGAIRSDLPEPAP